MKKLIFCHFFMYELQRLKMTLKPKKNYIFLIKAQAFSFPMIYNMSRYKKVDFLSFFDVRVSKWLQNERET